MSVATEPLLSSSTHAKNPARLTTSRESFQVQPAPGGAFRTVDPQPSRCRAAEGGRNSTCGPRCQRRTGGSELNVSTSTPVAQIPPSPQVLILCISWAPLGISGRRRYPVRVNKVAAPGQPSNAPALNWKVAALGAAALAVSAAIQPTGLGALAAGLVAVAIVSLAQRWPVSAGCAMLALFLVVSANETVRSPVVVFSVPFLVASPALAGHLRAAAAFAVALGYVCVTSPFTGQWLPYDLSGTVIFAATLAGACGRVPTCADSASSTAPSSAASRRRWSSAGSS